LTEAECSVTKALLPALPLGSFVDPMTSFARAADRGSGLMSRPPPSADACRDHSFEMDGDRNGRRRSMARTC
jgi:hypothetical protein